MTNRRVQAALRGVVVCALTAWGAGCRDVGAFLGNVALGVGGRTTGPYLQMDGADSVVISWFTPEPRVGEIEVSDPSDPAAATQTHTEPQPVEHHVIRVKGLQPGKVYTYRMIGAAATDTESHDLPAPKTQNARIVFAVLGDSGTGSLAQYAVLDQIEISQPDYIIHTGDVVYPNGADTFYDLAVFNPFTSVMDHVPIFPCLGNHDVAFFDGAAYLENFVLPENGPPAFPAERCYSIDLGNVHLVSVDRTRDPGTIADVILPWLQADLAASDAVWKFVVFHYPLYTSGTPTRPVNPLDLATWGAIFDATGVDLCFSGHNHYYERTEPIRDGAIVGAGEGTVYVVSGSGGASLYTLAPRAEYSAASNDQTYGFARVAVEGTRIEITHIDEFGSVLDEVSWNKP